MTLPPPDSAAIVQAYLSTRQTAHDFHQEAVPEDVVQRALQCAIRAPNHHLTNPWRFTWLGPRTRSALAAANAQLEADKRGASAAQAKYTRWMAVPGWMLVTSLRDEDPVREQENYAATCCALHNLVLALHAEDVSCKWTSGAVTRLPQFAQLTGFDPDLEQFVGLVWYGYAKTVTAPTKRQPVAEILRRRP